MASKKPDRRILGVYFAKEDFPNEDAWRATVETYMEGPGACTSCEHLVLGPFEWCGVDFDGVCTKHKQVVVNALYFPCPDGTEG